MQILRASIYRLLMFSLLVAAGMAQEKPAIIPDAQIEANVLKVLAGSPQLADQAISTTTVYGQVTLSGTVRDEASRDLAEKLVADTAGVQKVIDQLAVGNIAASEGGQMQGQNPAGEDATNPDGTYPPSPDEQSDANEISGQDQNSDASTLPPQNGELQQRGPSGSQMPCPGLCPPYAQPSQGQAQLDRGQQGGQSVVVPSGAAIRVRINQGMDSRHTAPGAIFDGTVLNDVIAGNEVAIPRGTAVQGQVVDARNAGALKGEGELALQLTQITLGGQIYPIASDEWMHQGANKTSQTIGNAAGLGAVGAMIGAVAGGGPGALLGAGLGGAAGMGVSATSRRGEAMVPAEAILTFHLTQPISLRTVSQAEMNRLASSIQADTRQMRRRPPPPPPPYYYYGPVYSPYYY
jgi:hypothetical protein